MELAKNLIPFRVVVAADHDPLLPLLNPNSKTPSTMATTLHVQRVSLTILSITSLVAVFLNLLPYELVDGNRVPAVIFNGLPLIAFHAFVVCVMLAFSGSFIALFAKERKPNVAMACLYYSVLFLVSALAILFSALFWTSAFGEALLQHIIRTRMDQMDG